MCVNGSTGRKLKTSVHVQHTLEKASQDAPHDIGWEWTQMQKRFFFFVHYIIFYYYFKMWKILIIIMSRCVQTLDWLCTFLQVTWCFQTLRSFQCHQTFPMFALKQERLHLNKCVYITGCLYKAFSCVTCGSFMKNRRGNVRNVDLVACWRCHLKLKSESYAWYRDWIIQGPLYASARLFIKGRWLFWPYL